MMEPTFSVVICTHNHAGLLLGALESICRQSLERSEYEIIVVDNNSTDDTRALVTASTWRDCGVRYCFEPAQGIAHARNCGWKHARGRYIAYLDDDCRAPEDWLESAHRILEEHSPMAFGGPYYASYEGTKPHWTPDSFNSYVPPLPEARPLARDEFWWLVGGNVFLSRTLFDAVGGFNVSLGHVGRTVAYGEESDLFRRISDRFPGTLYYDPHLAVTHLVRPEKLTLWYGIRASFGAGRSAVRSRHGLVPVARLRLLFDAIVAAVSLAADVMVRMPFRDRSRYRYPRNYVQDHSLHYVKRLGSLYEQASHCRCDRPGSLMWR